MKIVIILNALLNNRGSEALVRGLTEAIREKYPISEVWVISSEYEMHAVDNYIPGIDHYACRFSYRSSKSFTRYASSAAEKLIKSDRLEAGLSFHHLKAVVKEADHVIVVGADNYDASYNMFHKMHSMNLFLEGMQAENSGYMTVQSRKDILPGMF